VLSLLSSQLPERNRLLAALPGEQQAQLAPNLDSVRLEARQVLALLNQPIEHVYFPRGAVLTLLVPMEDRAPVGGAIVGNEGLVGLEVFLGSGHATEDIVVQIPGEAARMRAATFADVVRQSMDLQAALERYALALINQLVRTAGCNRLHSVDQRCARWLLMCDDRMRGGTFPFTHESLARLLGVRRASVTLAAWLFQQQGIIAYRHGWMSIVDRQRLEMAACEDYRLTPYDYERLH
jgi:CRP-like cAMP-binding protein